MNLCDKDDIYNDPIDLKVILYNILSLNRRFKEANPELASGAGLTPEFPGESASVKVAKSPEAPI